MLFNIMEFKYNYGCKVFKFFALIAINDGIVLRGAYA